jgi:ABC-type branched-subunit amino acid transport system ATPase component
MVEPMAPSIGLSGAADLAATVLADEERPMDAPVPEDRRDGGQTPLLAIRHVDFAYGQVQVLFDVSIDIVPGEVLALLGTNGAGKSTLLRVVSGLGRPSRGSVTFQERDITNTKPGERARLGIVQLPGGKAIFPSLTVRENLVAGARIIRDPREVDARIERTLELFPRLRERLEQSAGTLSGGEQQMLGLGQVLLLDPRLLVIDELSLGLAPVVVEQLLGVVEKLKQEGVTMVIVEQSINVALSIADRAVFMEKGQVRFEGAASDLIERDDLVRAVFLGADGS